MADVKISQLPAATTPVAGTEVLPIVQSGTTAQLSINGLTGITRPFTANGVVYASSTSALATGSALTFDGSNLGLGVTLPTIYSNRRALVIGGQAVASVYHYAGIGESAYNWYLDATPTAKYATTNYAGTFEFNNSATGGFAWKLAPSGTAGNAITFTQAMTLDASGNLGIGTTAPLAKLSVQSSASSTVSVRTTDAVFGSVTGGTALDCLNTSFAALTPFGIRGSTLTFGTSAGISATLDASGNLLVGTTSSALSSRIEVVNTNASPAGLFRKNNTDTASAITVWHGGATGAATATQIAFLRADSSTVGSITSTTTVTAYNTSSDYRLKDITGPITTSGAYIDSLNPVEGTWKGDGSTFVGLIAHEVQEASRTPVATGTKDGEEMQAMDYSSAEIIANLIAEIQSLRKRLAALESN